MQKGWFREKIKTFPISFSFPQDEMQLQLPMVVGKKVTEVEKEEKKEVETMKLRWELSRSYCSYIMYFWPRQILFPKSKMLSRWDQRGEAELRMEEGTLASKEQRQVNLFIKNPAAIWNWIFSLKSTIYYCRQVLEGQLVGQVGGLGVSGETAELLSLLSTSTLCRHFWFVPAVLKLCLPPIDIEKEWKYPLDPPKLTTYRYWNCPEGNHWASLLAFLPLQYTRHFLMKSACP